MTTLGDCKRVLDIELTNRCNARCSFCPRDATPKQGLMSFETFKKAIERAEELEVTPEINSAGQGEPLLHPQLIDFVRHMQSKGIRYTITTNASLLTKEKSQELLEADLHRINFSVGDLNEDYNEVYALDFETTHRNVLDFMELNQRREIPSKVFVNMVRHDINRDTIEKTQEFWKEAGVDGFLVFNQNNRGGACNNGDYIIGSDKYLVEAGEILAAEKLSTVCPMAFIFLFVGWNGNYYVCCNDYAKRTPLGTVFEYSIEEMDHIKKELLIDGGFGVDACRNCNLNSVNKVRETLFEIEHGIATKVELQEKLEQLRESQVKLPAWVRPL